MKLKKLSQKQIELMHSVRSKWLDKLFNRTVSFDKEKAIKGIEWLYGLSGLEKPMIVFVDSPLGTQYAVQMMNGLYKNDGGAQVWNKVRAQVRAQVWDQARAQVGDQVGAQVRDQVGDQVFRDFSSYGNIWDYVWCSSYEFFDLLKLNIFNKKNQSNLYKFISLLDSGVYDMIQLDGLCVACRLPTFISRDGIKLHNSSEMAIRWADGYGQNYLYGVYFDVELFKKVTRKNVSLKTIFTIENIEQRMTALKLNQHRLVEDKRVTLINDNSMKGNELFKVKEIFDEDKYFLRYKCPSTDREYISFVTQYAQERQDPDYCMARKFGLTKKEYLSIDEET